MTQSWKLCLASWLALGGVIASLGDCALAQITPDSTLGSENSTVTSTGSVDQINGGATRGANLFHSFEEFNIDEGRAAFFTNPAGIENILSRVTGTNASNILGTLGVSGGNADLFLINPNGIIFGPNASLSISGSFIASTASSLNFADGTQFSATALQTTPLLTINAPIGLQFGSNAGSIQVQGNGQGIRTTTALIDTTVGLRVQPFQTLALVGSNVTLEGGTLKTAGGRIELGSVAGSGLVSLTQIDKGWVLGYEGVSTFADIYLSDVAVVDASGEGGGDVQIQGRRVTLTDGSQIEASTLGLEPGGTLTVNASELVELIGDPADSQLVPILAAQVYPGATGDGGNVILKTGRLSVQDGSQILVVTYGTGTAGTLTVDAEELVELSGGTSVDGQFASSVLSASVQSGAKGSGGDLTLETRRLIVRNGAQIQAASFGMGAAGTLTVNAKELVEVIGGSASGPSGLFTSTYSSATTGTGGNLILTTQRLIIRDGAQIQAVTFGAGAGGTLTVTAKESVEVIGTTANTLTRTAKESVEVIGSTANGQNSSVLSTSVQPGATGAGGNLTLTTQRLSVRNGAQISAGTLGTGVGGTLAVTASDLVEVIGKSADGHIPSGLFTGTQSAGDAGDLTIATRQLIVQDQATVDVNSVGLESGNAGDLNIAARSINLNNQGKLIAETEQGLGGNITLQSQDLILMRHNSEISTEAGGTGSGGNINIDTKQLVALENSDIIANAFEGQGGNIQITTQGLFLSPNSDITASSEFGVDGVVEINTPDIDPSQGLVSLLAVPVDTEVAQACTPGGSQANSEFVVTGRGGLPPTPTEALSSDAIQVDWVTLNPGSENSSSSEKARNLTASEPAPIVEAQGWVIDPNGEVVLTASAVPVLPHSSWQTPSECRAAQSAPGR